jgi:uroporphyrinogen-III synthase
VTDASESDLVAACALRGRVVAVPETRHLEVLASLLEKRGATVLRCPLVAIKDSDDERSVVAWIERLTATPPDVLIFYTGEGVNRLAGFAERAGIGDRFAAAIRRTVSITRGPKPKRALASLGISPTHEAPEPTTAGILTALDALPLDGKRAAVQLFGEAPPPELSEYLARRHIDADFVAPYVYADEADDEHVVALIRRLDRGEIDAIAFTSKSQVERLRSVASERGLEPELARGLAATRVAAVGPVVAAELEAAGVSVDVVPTESFHMKPLVNALAASFG